LFIYLFIFCSILFRNEQKADLEEEVLKLLDFIVEEQAKVWLKTGFGFQGPKSQKLTGPGIALMPAKLVFLYCLRSPKLSVCGETI
jgi:hypothetical protein